MISIIGNPSEQVFTHGKNVNVAGKHSETLKQKIN